MTYPKACLRRGEEAKAAGSILYDNQIDWIDDTCQNGEVVDVLDSRMRFVLRGFLNTNSKIAVRVLTRNEAEEIDEAFFRRRIEAAWAYRKALGFSNSCRVIFGAADGLPGLTADKYADYLSFQIVSLGMEKRKDLLLSILTDVFSPKGIFERDDLLVREKEGLPLVSACVRGSVPESVTIREHDAEMLVNIREGQKTGHFLDQQENRGRIRPYCKDKTVLDLCCCTGGFSIHAALYGAKSVESVDVSETALSLVRQNAARNAVAEKIQTTCADVFDLARSYAEQGRQYGLVICDPPAFAKSRSVLPSAYRGYKELNLRAMLLTEPGGFLLSCSCSQFMTPELFLQMLREAAADAKRPVRLLESLIQSRDHPAVLSDDHSLYLKGYLLQVL